MRVVLLQFELDTWDFWGDALGLQYLAAELRKKGNEVEIISIPMNPDSLLLQTILRDKPGLIGFSLPCPFETRFGTLGHRLKEQLPATHITCGNRYASDNSELMLQKYSWLDSVIRGEGELTIVDMVMRLEEGKSLEGCKGVFYRVGGEIVKNEERELIQDLDDVGFPARDILLKLPKEKNATFISGRGCVNNCTFCNSSYTDGQKGRVWRGRTPGNVVDELEMVSEKLGYKNFFFADPSYEEPGRLGKQRIKEIAEEILRRGLEINYGVYFSAHRWDRSDLPLLELLRQSGMEYVYVGIEAGTPESLALYNKKATIADNYRMLELLREAGIGVKFGFIMFHPYLTLEELRRNVEFVHTAKIGYSFRCYNNELEVYKGTKIHEILEQDGLLTGETDREIGNYRWSFKDSGTALVRKLTEEVVRDNRCIQKEIGLEYKVISFIHRLKNKAMRAQKYTEEVFAFEDSIELLYNSMNELNYYFMTDTIRLVQEGFDENRFRQIEEPYIRQMEELVEDLEKKVFAFSFKAKKKGLL